MTCVCYSLAPSNANSFVCLSLDVLLDRIAFHLLHQVDYCIINLNLVAYGWIDLIFFFSSFSCWFFWDEGTTISHTLQQQKNIQTIVHKICVILRIILMMGARENMRSGRHTEKRKQKQQHEIRVAEL